ncbi:MAG: serine/threonine-protein kinase, partial [Pseudomonadota bacterium]
MSEHSDIALPSGYRLQNYVIDRVLGQGGFGITYLAHDEALNQRVAIKEFFPSSVTSRNAATSAVHAQTQSVVEVFQWGLQRFLEEARILARLSHPNIVRVLYFMPANNTGYMVMEYEDGEPLDQWAKRFDHGCLTQPELTTLMEPVTDALSKVHELGLAHRDIKPENIFIRDDGSPVILDFGAARNTVAGRSHTVAAIVSPGFSPIEQYSDVAEQGPWTDVYATAAVAYSLIEGKAPADAPTRVSSIQEERPDPVHNLAAGNYQTYDKRFLAAIDRGLSLRASQRPQSMEEWREELFDGARANAGSSRRKGARPGQAGRANDQGSGGLGTAGTAFLGIVGVAAAIGAGVYFFDAFSEKDRIGESAETALDIGALSTRSERVTERIGGSDKKDVIRFQLTQASDLRLGQIKWPDSATLELLNQDGKTQNSLQQGSNRVWRLRSGTYYLHVASEGVIPGNYELELAANSLEPGALSKGTDIANAISLSIDQLLSTDGIRAEGTLWRSGQETFYGLNVRRKLQLDATASSKAGSRISLSLVGSDGLALGEAKQTGETLSALLTPGKYGLVVTSREGSPRKYELAASAKPAAPGATQEKTTVTDGSTFDKAIALANNGQSKVGNLNLEFSSGQSALFTTIALEKRRLLQVRSGVESVSEIAVFDRKSRERIALWTPSDSAAPHSLDIPKGDVVIRFSRVAASTDKAVIRVRLVDPSSLVVDLGQVTDKPVSR